MKLVVLKEELEGVVGFAATTARRLENQGLFPRRRQLAPGRVGWFIEDLREWARSRPDATGKMRGEATRLARAKANPGEPEAT